MESAGMVADYLTPDGTVNEGARFDRNINMLYDAYLMAKTKYKSNGTTIQRQKVTEALERLMAEIQDLLFDIHNDCDFKEGRELVAKYVRMMHGSI